MPLIRQPLLDPNARDAVVLHLGDLKLAGDRLKESARREAESILSAGRTERDRIVAGARNVGHAAGLQQGIKEGHEKGREEGKKLALAEWRDRLTSLEQGWAAALETFLSERERMMIEARRDVVRLALLLAERLTKRALAADPGLVADQVAEVLALVARPTRLIIAVHPEDRAIVQEVLPALARRFPNTQGIEIVDDGALARGSCIARTAGGRIDASVDTQLDRIAEALLPGDTKRLIDPAPASAVSSVAAPTAADPADALPPGPPAGGAASLVADPPATPPSDPGATA